jgi:hydrogenase-4 membrane subunit HyfE
MGVGIKSIFGAVILMFLYLLGFPFSAQLFTDLRTPAVLRMILTVLYLPLLLLASQSEVISHFLSRYVEFMTGADIGFG